ncbi:MAG: hypothetical protein Q7R52_03830 [archaeon]|nr:hypothetical protein [archaeon]
MKVSDLELDKESIKNISLGNLVGMICVRTIKYTNDLTDIDNSGRLPLFKDEEKRLVIEEYDKDVTLFTNEIDEREKRYLGK